MRHTMYRSGSSLLITLFVTLLGLVLVIPTLFAQQSASASKPLVVLTSLTSPPDDPVAESLASTITSSIGLELWNSARPQARPRFIRRDITDILSSFYAADAIALAAEDERGCHFTADRYSSRTAVDLAAAFR